MQTAELPYRVGERDYVGYLATAPAVAEFRASWSHTRPPG